MRFTCFVLIAIIFCAVDLSAQQQKQPLNRAGNLWLERYLNNPAELHHTSFKPLNISALKLDSLQHEEHNRWQRKQRESWFGRKLRNENLIVVNEEQSEFNLTIDPLFNFEYGIDLADNSARADTTRFYKNTRGVLIQGNIGKKFSFMSSFYENQAVFPSYIDSFVMENAEKGFGLVPGQGRAKSFKNGGYDYAMASGYISYSPSSHFNLQAGHGKHFIGEGYRSLLLSDNAFNYPYLKITTTFGKGRFQYTNLYASMQSLNRLPASSTSEALFERKAGTFHYLSYAPFKWVQIGLFEGVIWQRRDSTSSLPFNYNSINPIIGINTAINGFDSNNNALLGLNLKVIPLKNYVLYAQFIIDNKIENGYQVGVKLVDAFGLRNLSIQSEFNTVAAYTYGHKLPLQNYGHYNQALAHPWGADFKELVSFLNYSWRDFFVEYKFDYGTYQEDYGTSHYGKDIFKSNDDKTSISIEPDITTLANHHITTGYLINQKTNMRILLGLTYRTESNPIWNKTTQFIYLGFRTSLTNQYYDF